MSHAFSHINVSFFLCLLSISKIMKAAFVSRPLLPVALTPSRYYFEKFGITPMHTNIHDRLRAAYVEGLVWCLAYYYRGCVSWSWFFPFHYVPMISDLVRMLFLFTDVQVSYFGVDNM